jgi:peptidoglycan/LPS O-acetylase OafA/YrhL
MRYRLRTLLILLALAPPVLAGAWIVSNTIVNQYWAARIPVDEFSGNLSLIIEGGQTIHEQSETSD